jgi:hypothetical protein
VTILGFALVFLEGYDGGCSGNSCDIEARFVRANITTDFMSGGYNEDSFVHYVRLIE